MKTAVTTAQLLSRLRMRQVLLLLVIERQGTLRAAATELGVTQPAASKMLRELEGALGHALFERVGRRLRLTASGDSVLHHFRGLHGTMEALNRELQELQLGSAGKLKIGSIMAASPDMLTNALLRLREQYPLLAVEIAVATSDRLLEMLRDGAIDLVVGRVPGAITRNYVFQPVGEEALAVIAASEHPLAARRKLSFADMLAYPWILQPVGSPMREVMELEFRKHHAPLPKGLIETASILTTTNLIARSQMIAVIPQSVASHYQRHQLLRILAYRVEHKLPSFGTLVCRERPASTAAARFMQILHEKSPAQSARRQTGA